MSDPNTAPVPKRLVLVADDEPSVRRAITWLLRSSCEVIPCPSSGLEIVDIALASQPDVIICDAMMPAFFGCETLQPLDEFPFVLVGESTEDIRHWIEQGRCCVVHPMDLDTDLALAVEAAAAGRLYVSRRALDPTNGPLAS